MAVMAFAGMSVAQDIWSCGYFRSNDVQQAAVYKNDTRMFYTSLSNGYYADCTDIDVDGSDVYWVRNAYNQSGSFHYADVMKNNSTYLDSPTGQGRHIYDLYRLSSINSLYSVGCIDVDNVRTAVTWKDNNPDVYRQMGDGNYESVAYGITHIVEPNGSFLYTCGYQYSNSSTYHGVIWRGSSVYHEFEDGTKILGITCFDGNLYTVGIVDETYLRVWEIDVPDGSTYIVYNSLSSEAFDRPERTNIFVDDAGDVYVVGVTSGIDRLYKNGEEIYNTSAYFASVSVNSDGVYYSGSTDNNGSYYGEQHGRIWKDGAYLYSPSDCQLVSNILVEEPTCTNNEARSLPYFEGFETGDTDWPCWTTIDVDNNNGGSHYRPFWSRRGTFSGAEPYAGNYFADHGWGVNAQEGWLISPKLLLQANSQITLTFQSNEMGDEYPDYRGVWISTSGTNTSDFVEVWSQSDPDYSWHEVTVDLSDYQGEEIYIAFKTTGTDGIGWRIDNVSVTAEGGPDMYTVTTEVDPVGAGTVDGGGEYPEQATVILTANPNPGWVFDHWNGGSTANPYIFNIAGDVTFIAYFLQEEYTLTLNAFPAEGGQVSANPAGPYHLGDMVTLTATPNPGYTFVSWQDGSTDAMRTVEVTGDATYNAIFTQGGATMYTVNVVSENPLLGSVTGGGTFPAGTVIEIGATPSPSARFVSWDDGNTDNPRTITVTGDVTYTARFEALPNYTITVVSANPTMGSATGGGTFMEGTVINISATPLTGYYFIGWSDGNADNPRSITVTANETYVAQFGTNPVQTFTLTVMCNSSEGTTIGSGTYTAGSTATIAAFPNSGYLFDKWQDNVTDNPRQVTVTGDMTFVAFFKSTGVGENEGRLLVLYPNPANDYIRIEGLEANSEVKIYNAMGALVKVVNVNANEEIGISELSDGLYVLRCGNATLRFVKK